MRPFLDLLYRNDRGRLPARADPIMLSPEERDALVAELATRPGHEKVRVLVHRLMVDGLGADSRDMDFEKPVPEVHGRIDALLGRTVLEFKSDLRRERRDAEEELSRYLSDRQRVAGTRYVGLATDGADFTVYFLKSGRLREAGGYRTDASASRELLVWLQSAVAVGDELLPEPDIIRREFGRHSIAARRALDELGELWAGVAEMPGARLKRELWNRLLSLAYGAGVGDDGLFLQHTYLAVIAKAVAWNAMIDTPPADAAAVLHGEAFSHLGISGQSEPDFFDWILAARGGSELVMQMVRLVGRFRLADIRMDVLKALYESLIDPDTRHDLGEYYTPDWLAARMVAAAVDKPLEQRVMDPACGSGAFLFHAVRAVLAGAEAAGLSPVQQVERAISRVAGIDIHPVAVIFARVTYLLALMPALRAGGHPGALAVPVYLGDALQWNLNRPDAGGHHGPSSQPPLLADDETLNIFVPAIRVSTPGPRQLAAVALCFPAAVASDAALFDRVLNSMIEFGARGEPLANFAAWLEREGAASKQDRRVLKTTYTTMRRLQEEGRNHIWGYVARNLARPVWLASEAQKADVVLGNPPWVSYRYMSGDFKERFRWESRAAGLWVGGKVATQQDLSGYFYLRAAGLYMRRAGRMAMVLPAAALSRQAYAPFRAGEVVRFGQPALRLRFTQAWAFGPEVQPLFPVPSCVLFAEVQAEDAGPKSVGTAGQDARAPGKTPGRILAFAGSLPRRDADRAEADATLTETPAPWPAVASSDPAGSPYRKAFRQGATLVPRRFVLVEPVMSSGRLPPNPAFPLVRGRAGNLDKAPWKDLPPPQGTLERAFLRPVLLGESIVPFCVLGAHLAVIPWAEGELMDAARAAERGYPRLSHWLKNSETVWERHKRSGHRFTEQLDYYGKLSAQFPIAPIRVVYTAAGTYLAACVVENETAIIDNSLYWAAVEDVAGAWYLCAVFNSWALRDGVAVYQSQGQWGARHFDKYVFNLPIPRFEGENALHRALAEAAQTAAGLAHSLPRKEGEHFTRVRRRVRAALAEHGVAGHMEGLVAQLLDSTREGADT